MKLNKIDDNVADDELTVSILDNALEERNHSRQQVSYNSKEVQNRGVGIERYGQQLQSNRTTSNNQEKRRVYRIDRSRLDTLLGRLDAAKKEDYYDGQMVANATEVQNSDVGLDKRDQELEEIRMSIMRSNQLGTNHGLLEEVKPNNNQEGNFLEDEYNNALPKDVYKIEMVKEKADFQIFQKGYDSRHHLGGAVNEPQNNEDIKNNTIDMLTNSRLDSSNLVGILHHLDETQDNKEIQKKLASIFRNVRLSDAQHASITNMMNEMENIKTVMYNVSNSFLNFPLCYIQNDCEDDLCIIPPNTNGYDLCSMTTFLYYGASAFRGTIDFFRYNTSPCEKVEECHHNHSGDNAKESQNRMQSQQLHKEQQSKLISIDSSIAIFKKYKDAIKKNNATMDVVEFEEGYLGRDLDTDHDENNILISMMFQKVNDELSKLEKDEKEKDSDMIFRPGFSRSQINEVTNILQNLKDVQSISLKVNNELANTEICNIPTNPGYEFCQIPTTLWVQTSSILHSLLHCLERPNGGTCIY